MALSRTLLPRARKVSPQTTLSVLLARWCARRNCVPVHGCGRLSSIIDTSVSRASVWRHVSCAPATKLLRMFPARDRLLHGSSKSQRGDSLGQTRRRTIVVTKRDPHWTPAAAHADSCCKLPHKDPDRMTMALSLPCSDLIDAFCFYWLAAPHDLCDPVRATRKGTSGLVSFTYSCTPQRANNSESSHRTQHGLALLPFRSHRQRGSSTRVRSHGKYTS